MGDAPSMWPAHRRLPPSLRARPATRRTAARAKWRRCIWPPKPSMSRTRSFGPAKASTTLWPARVTTRGTAAAPNVAPRATPTRAAGGVFLARSARSEGIRPTAASTSTYACGDNSRRRQLQDGGVHQPRPPVVRSAAPRWDTAAAGREGCKLYRSLGRNLARAERSSVCVYAYIGRSREGELSKACSNHMNTADASEESKSEVADNEYQRAPVLLALRHLPGGRRGYWSIMRRISSSSR
ncbi:hypothetical protein PybrP1_003749 [[Pythium] brassicae (nom. inval.)]|nr:hypothetical protein PybrP1_003749 [[Pythium] brassicae (nom. inval.)]